MRSGGLSEVTGLLYFASPFSIETDVCAVRRLGRWRGSLSSRATSSHCPDTVKTLGGSPSIAPQFCAAGCTRMPGWNRPPCAPSTARATKRMELISFCEVESRSRQEVALTETLFLLTKCHCNSTLRTDSAECQNAEMSGTRLTTRNIGSSKDIVACLTLMHV